MPKHKSSKGDVKKGCCGTDAGTGLARRRGLILPSTSKFAHEQAFTMEALTAGAVTSFGAAIDKVFSKALSFTGRCGFAFPQSLPVQLPAMQLRAHILPVTHTQQSKHRSIPAAWASYPPHYVQHRPMVESLGQISSSDSSGHDSRMVFYRTVVGATWTRTVRETKRVLV
jgi:hypothetical protein